MIYKDQKKNHIKVCEKSKKKIDVSINENYKIRDRNVFLKILKAYCYKKAATKIWVRTYFQVSRLT